MVESLDKSKKQVLVVEDSKMMLKIYQTQFNNSAFLQGFQLSSCTNAPDAHEWLLQYVTFHKTLPELIILDWIMPGKIDGFGLLTLLKKNDTYKAIPIIMVSSIGDKLKIVKALKMGISDYLMKPVNVQKLIDRVVKYTEPQVA